MLKLSASIQQVNMNMCVLIPSQIANTTTTITDPNPSYSEHPAPTTSAVPAQA